jgi:hypothetical protein
LRDHLTSGEPDSTATARCGVPATPPLEAAPPPVPPEEVSAPAAPPHGPRLAWVNPAGCLNPCTYDPTPDLEQSKGGVLILAA